MKAALHNLGCKVNEYEMESMAGDMRAHGFTIVPFAPGADVYIINTCTVTNIADQKSRQMLHKAKHMNPHALVCAVGCYVDVRREALEKDPLIDLVLTNEEKNTGIAQRILEVLGTQEGTGAETDLEAAHNGMGTDHTRRFIKIQDGCNAFCSYCIIPYARGRERSRPEEDILTEIADAARSGHREVVLTGIHISSYGADTGTDLCSLLEKVQKVDGIERIRLGSLEPRIVDETFLKRLSGISAFCPQFHLSLQSGSDSVLARMNRHYTTQEYEGIVQGIRSVFPDAAITTDIIVGFPQETDEEFAETLAFVLRIAFAKIHVFRYARREGTKAAVMDGQVEEGIKAARAKELAALGEKLSRRFAERFVGRNVEVLAEEEKDGYIRGYTPEYVPVIMDRLPSSVRGQIVSFRPTSAEGGVLR